MFEFLRNGKLYARNFFAADQDSLKRNQFGGSAGGPIKKDKVFFFGTYQSTRIRTAPGGQIAFVPTAAERGGDFFDFLAHLTGQGWRGTLASFAFVSGWPPLPVRLHSLNLNVEFGEARVAILTRNNLTTANLLRGTLHAVLL